MIDERSHSGLMAMRAGGGGGASLGGRLGDAMPDYDNVKVSFVMQIYVALAAKWSTIVFDAAPPAGAIRAWQLNYCAHFYGPQLMAGRGKTKDVAIRHSPYFVAYFAACGLREAKRFAYLSKQHSA